MQGRDKKKSGKLDIKKLIIKEYQKQKITYLEKGKKKTLEMTTEPEEHKKITAEEFMKMGANYDPLLGRKMTEAQKGGETKGILENASENG